MICKFIRIAFLVAVAALLQESVALAHVGHHPHGPVGPGRWMEGLLHPLLGFDHWLAMLASGLLAVRVNNRQALWVVPLSFVGLMWVGGVIGSFGIPLLLTSWMVSLSVIVLGLTVALFRSLPLSMVAGIVGFCAIGHGHLHVLETGAIDMIPFFVGLSVTTLLLHGVAIAIGLWAMQVDRPILIRIAGAAIAICLSIFLFV